MPVRNSIADRINETRIILKTALIRNNKVPKDIEKRKIMHANTFYVKQAKTDRLKLSDLWRLDDMLHFTDEEILKMFGINGTFGKITYREYQKTEYLHDDSEAKEILQEKISDFLESLGEKGVQIISKDVKIETKRAGWTAHGELLLREAAVSLVDSRAEDTGAEDLDRNED